VRVAQGHVAGAVTQKITHCVQRNAVLDQARSKVMTQIVPAEFGSYRIHTTGFQKIRPHADAVGYGCAWRERIKTRSTGEAQAQEVISMFAMKTRRLGSGGLEVSALGLGCMSMSTAYVAGCAYKRANGV
jgi:hypothetical protein